MNEFNYELAIANATTRANNLIADAQAIAVQFYFSLFY